MQKCIYDCVYIESYEHEYTLCKVLIQLPDTKVACGSEVRFHLNWDTRDRFVFTIVTNVNIMVCNTYITCIRTTELGCIHSFKLQALVMLKSQTHLFSLWYLVLSY